MWAQLSFCHSARVCQTDRRRDRPTERLWQYRVLHYMQSHGKNLDQIGQNPILRSNGQLWYSYNKCCSQRALLCCTDNQIATSRQNLEYVKKFTWRAQSSNLAFSHVVETGYQLPRILTVSSAFLSSLMPAEWSKHRDVTQTDVSTHPLTMGNCRRSHSLTFDQISRVYLARWCNAGDVLQPMWRLVRIRIKNIHYQWRI